MQGKSKIKRKKESNKGITLIALVITIIVLLILAGVTIAAISGDNGILQNAARAKEETDVGTEKEQITLAISAARTDNSESLTEESLRINLVNRQGNDATVTLNGNKMIVKFNESEREYTVNIDGEIMEEATPGIAAEGKEVYDGAVIPNGFTVSEEVTEQKVDRGLVVIAPDGSEFVWIPVDSNEEIAVLQEGSSTNYQGILYNFIEKESEIIAEKKQIDSIGGILYREPDIVAWDGDKYDNDPQYLNIMNSLLNKKYLNSKDFYKDLQIDFNNMIKSIQKNGGFFVGRYELSVNKENETISSKKGVLPATAAEESLNSWYGLYAYSKLMSNKNNYSDVQSHMIFGCNWDSMLKYALNGEEKLKVLSKENAPHNLDSIYNTGSIDTDVINNIYDLEGNAREWTAEANYTTQRVFRGGYHNYEESPSSRIGRDPFNTYNNAGTRVILYINNY